MLFTDKQGCAARCGRWGDPSFVCNTCPCLGSAHAETPPTVNPNKDNEEAPPDPRVLRIRELRKLVTDGVAIKETLI